MFILELKTKNMRYLSILFVAMFFAACNRNVSEPVSEFVIVEDGHFVKNGKPYYYVGTNFWYGAILASEGQGATVNASPRSST